MMRDEMERIGHERATAEGPRQELERHPSRLVLRCNALEVATGLVRVGPYARRRRRMFLDFMNGIVARYPDTELHVILDNLNTHKPKHGRWLVRHPHVHFHYPPTHASWLNQVECWFSLLWRQALRGLNATSPRDVRKAIDAFTAAGNTHPHPFEWTKTAVHPGGFRLRYADLRN